MTTQPRRRWFRFAFSLRTLFVVVTIFGVWLGWNHKIVRERKAVLAEIDRIGQYQPHRWLERLASDPISTVPHENVEDIRVSSIRHFMGDESCLVLFLPYDLNANWISRAEQAFPEAVLVLQDGREFVRYGPGYIALRDSLYAPQADHFPNEGTVFRTGFFEK